MENKQQNYMDQKRLKNRTVSQRLLSRERYRHDRDQNAQHNLHSKEPSFRAQAEYDNSFINNDLNTLNTSSRTLEANDELSDELSYAEQYRTDGEAHNYRGELADDKFGEYPRYGKNLNRQARAHRSFVGVGPKGYKRSDERIEDEICEALARDKYIDASDIEVDVEDGIVTLSGSVTDRDDRLDAEVLVERVLGVEDIKNDIKVNRRSLTLRQ